MWDGGYRVASVEATVLGDEPETQRSTLVAVSYFRPGGVIEFCGFTPTGTLRLFARYLGADESYAFVAADESGVCFFDKAESVPVFDPGYLGYLGSTEELCPTLGCSPIADY